MKIHLFLQLNVNTLLDKIYRMQLQRSQFSSKKISSGQWKLPVKFQLAFVRCKMTMSFILLFYLSVKQVWWTIICGRNATSVETLYKVVVCELLDFISAFYIYELHITLRFSAMWVEILIVFEKVAVLNGQEFSTYRNFTILFLW